MEMNTDQLAYLDTLVSLCGITEVLVALAAIAEDRAVGEEEKHESWEKVFVRLKKLGIYSGNLKL